jgi:hypothetical protein
VRALVGGLMPKGLVTMSASEIDRGDLIRRVREKRLTQPNAAALMGLSVRQVKRLCRLFKQRNDADWGELAPRARRHALSYAEP